ncbi:FecR domain-containing protein [Fulvivirgaceae bacterium BMA12]|uniref:FecR domain-containing protein n=1 Tax=Agaribacillus aureus TaxID=3051825 RepID=A0ABT8L652_9BACT|nr:FecR domain-containing protein [Fulvivirgaceae bacterium BMA12]
MGTNIVKTESVIDLEGPERRALHFDKKHMEYSKFEVEDFIMDPFFQKWVLESDEMADTFWKAWLLDHPEKKAQVEEAIGVIKTLKFKNNKLSKEDFQDLWKDIIADRRTGQYRLSKPRIPVKLVWSGVAAAFLVLCLAAGYLFFGNPIFSHDQVAWQTGFGEKKEIILPDSSVVILNANSKLQYPGAWDDDQERTVQLNGEAFFSIIHKKNNQKFVVHSGDLNIEVLGTAFNVNNRRGSNKVILNKGSVRLDLSAMDWQEWTHQSNESYLLMEPGEMVVVDRDEKEISKKIVNPEKYTSWTEGVLIFDKTPLEEVIRMIEDNYGYAVYTGNLNVRELDFTGELYSTELDLILEYLSETFDLKVKKENKKIMLIKDD